MSADPLMDLADAAIALAAPGLRATLERNAFEVLTREPCAWCVGVGGDPGQCLACAGKGYFLTEGPSG